MGKGWDLGSADAGCTGKSCHSAAPYPYDWLPAGRSHAAYMHASGAPSSHCEQRWTLEMVAIVEVATVHLWLTAAGPPLAVVPDPIIVPALACNTFL
ncbi:hypothetical protein GmHk_20G057205 [Glycine max]|nr:hypothetical protein GmHk_20G057205 [Glycine max]